MVGSCRDHHARADAEACPGRGGPLRPSRRGLLALAALGLPAREAPAQSALDLITGTDGWFFRAHEPRMGLNAAGLRSVAGLVGEAVGVLRRAGVKVVLSLSPLRVRTYREHLPSGVRLSAETEARYGAALRALRGTGAPVLDLASAFARRRTEPDAPLLFFRTDTHWTPPGAALAATAMAALIHAEAPPLPPSLRPGTRLGPVRTGQHYGDMLLLMTDEARRRVPHEALEFRRVLPPEGGLLDDDAPPDVTVVGSSFMKPEWGYAPALSETLDRPVGLTWAVHPTGPYRTLLRAVAEEGFRRRRPSLLVWHLLEDDVDLEPTRNDVWRGSTMTGAAFLAELRRSLGG